MRDNRRCSSRNLFLQFFSAFWAIALILACGPPPQETSSPITVLPTASPYFSASDQSKVAETKDGPVTVRNLSDVPWLYPTDDQKRDLRSLAEDTVIAGALAREATPVEADLLENYTLLSRTLRLAMAANELYREAITSRVRSATEGWLAAEYEGRREEFNERHWWWFQFIHLNITPATPQAAAVSRAQSLIERIRDGEGFTELAIRVSESDAKATAIGPVTEKDDLNPMLKSALLDLEPGEISGPIITASSVKIVRLLNHEHRPALNREKAYGVLRNEFAFSERDRAIVEFEKELIGAGGSPPDPALAGAFQSFGVENAFIRYDLTQIPQPLFQNEAPWPALFARAETRLAETFNPLIQRQFQAEWALSVRLQEALGPYDQSRLHWPSHVLHNLRLRDIGVYDKAYGELLELILEEKEFRWVGGD